MSKSPTPEQVLQRLEWTVLRRLDGLLHGDYRTLFRGFGLDLADLREYQYHDDVRHIDWNVTARLQTPYVREFNEEREVAAWFLLDLEPVGRLRLGRREEAVGGHRLRHRAGADAHAPWQPRRRDVLRRRRGHRDSRARAAAATCCTSCTGCMNRPRLALAPATNLNELLRTGFDVMKRRSVVFVVSDFISVPGWGKMLGTSRQRHEVVAVRLYDPLEMELPDLGLLVVQDAETGEQIFVDTHDKGFRKRFAAAAEKREAELRTEFRHAGVDALELADRRRPGRRDHALRRPAQAAQPARRRRRHAAAPAESTDRPAWTSSGPTMLWLLLIVPALVLAYVLLLRKKKKLRCATRASRW